VVRPRSWIGQGCFLHSAGGITIGEDVGVAPGVMILTSTHRETPAGTPIIFGALELGAVEIGDGCDIGIGAIFLPGARVGSGVQVGAGTVVKGEFADDVVIAGMPAHVIRARGTLAT